jgi:hypothetical protein
MLKMRLFVFVNFIVSMNTVASRRLEEGLSKDFVRDEVETQKRRRRGRRRHAEDNLPFLVRPQEKLGAPHMADETGLHLDRLSAGVLGSKILIRDVDGRVMPYEFPLETNAGSIEAIANNRDLLGGVDAAIRKTSFGMGAARRSQQLRDRDSETDRTGSTLPC